MLSQSPIYHQNKDDEVRFYSAISMYIYMYYLYLLRALGFICIYLLIDTQIIVYANKSVNKKLTYCLTTPLIIC